MLLPMMVWASPRLAQKRGVNKVAQEIHRWRSTTGDPLAAGSWDSGVAPGVSATKDLTFTAVALNNETVTISGLMYTFKTTINNGVAREVYHGASATDSAANLAAAINAGAGAGTAYSTATVAHYLAVSAYKYGAIASALSNVMTATAWSLGTYANDFVTISEASTVASWAGGATTLSGGVINWAVTAIVLFDGITNFPCQGTTRLDDIGFVMWQTENAEHDIGTPTSPFRWNQYANGAPEHVLEGGGNLYLEHGAIAVMLGGYRFFTINRIPGSYLEFQKDPGILNIRSGIVGIKQTSGSEIGLIIIDGLDADVTVIAGKLTGLLSRNGHFISNSASTQDIGIANWRILGGIVETLTPIGEGSVVLVDGGALIPKPLTVPSMNYAPDFVISGGVLDLTESVRDVPGHLILLPGGTIRGGLAAPQGGVVQWPR